MGAFLLSTSNFTTAPLPEPIVERMFPSANTHPFRQAELATRRRRDHRRLFLPFGNAWADAVAPRWSGPVVCLAPLLPTGPYGFRSSHPPRFHRCGTDRVSPSHDAWGTNDLRATRTHQGPSLMRRRGGRRAGARLGTWTLSAVAGRTHHPAGTSSGVALVEVLTLGPARGTVMPFVIGCALLLGGQAAVIRPCRGSLPFGRARPRSRRSKPCQLRETRYTDGWNVRL